jgi:hypothetical protein
VSKPDPSALRYFAGLDLGQAADYTALAVMERPRVTRQTRPEAGQWRPAYTLRHCARFELGTPYPNIVEQVTAMLGKPSVAGCALAVDQTGVGRPVVDLFRRVGRPTAITITAGSESKQVAEGEWHVAKRALVSTLQLLFQAGRVRIPQIPDRELLVKELLAFRVKVQPSGHESLEAWRERDHDDLVLAVALAAFLGEQALAAEQREAVARPAVRRLVTGRPPSPFADPW